MDALDALGLRPVGLVLPYVPTTQVPLLATILGLPTGTTGTVHRGRVCLLKGRAGMVPTVSASGTASSPATRPARARSTPTEPTESGAKAGAGASAGGSRGWVDAAVLETSIADFLLPFIPPGRYCRSGLATSVVRLPEQQDILPAVRSCTAKWKVASEEVLQSGEPQTSIPCSAALPVAYALSLFKLRLPVPGTAACTCRGRVQRRAPVPAAGSLPGCGCLLAAVMIVFILECSLQSHGVHGPCTLHGGDGL